MEDALKGKVVPALNVLALLCMPAFGQITADDWNNKGVALADQGKPGTVDLA